MVGTVREVVGRQNKEGEHMIISVTTSKRVKQTMRNIYHGNIKGVQIGIRHGLFEMGRENVKHVRKLIRDKNKNGRIYMFRGRPHQASAPDEAPANMTGNLAKSSDYDVRGHVEMTFGERAFYADFLDKGTTKMKPRPHLKRTVDERGEQNASILMESVNTSIHKRAGKSL